MKTTHSIRGRAKKVFGIRFFDGSLLEATSFLLSQARSAVTSTKVVVTPNVDHIVRLEKDNAFREVYKQAEYYFPDSAPIVIASRVLGAGLKSRVTGADLMPALLKGLEGEKALIVGGFPGDEQSIEYKVMEEFPGAEIRCISPPDQFRLDSEEAIAILESAKEFHPLITFVCIGSPKQEEFAQVLKSHDVGALILCCGAALDFIMGNCKRAPVIIQRLGMEWLYRLAGDPFRLWRRYLVDDAYFALVFLRELRKKLLRPS